MITDGLEIMVVGMGTVFALLIFIVIAIAIASRILHACGCQVQTPAAATAPTKKPHCGAIAAIAAALTLYRRKQHKDGSHD